MLKASMIAICRLKIWCSYRSPQLWNLDFYSYNLPANAAPLPAKTKWQVGS